MSKDILRDLRGFGTVEKWVLTDPKIHASAKGLYALLCAFAGDKGQAFPGTELLRHQLGLSKNTLHKYIKQLEEFGVIRVEQERKGGKFSQNVYSLLPQGYALAVSQNLGDHKMGDQKMGSQNLDTNNNSLKNNSLKSNSNKTPIPPQGADGDLPKPDDEQKPKEEDPPKPLEPEKKTSGYSEKFEQWWSLYPKKVGKGAAWKKWKSEKLEKRFDELIEKLKQQNAMEHAFMNPQYIVGASRYLNEARYDDEVVFKGKGNEINSAGNQRKESTMERARRKQRELLASLDGNPNQGINQHLDIHD